MTAGKCPDCGNEFRNVEAHKRFCKNKKDEEKLDTIIIEKTSQSSSAEQQRSDLSVQSKPDISKLCTSDTTTNNQSWMDKVISKITVTNDSMDEYKNFLGKLPKFSVSPPGFFKRLLLKRGLTYKTFVFVDKKGKGEVAYLPYDEDKQRVIIDKVGYWQIEVGGDIVYLSKEHLLPLAQVPDLSRFQNSANYVLSVYNGGIQEGLTLRFDELMDEIHKDRMLKYLCIAVAVLALITLAVTSYNDGNTIKGLIAVNDIQSHQLINLTKVH